MKKFLSFILSCFILLTSDAQVPNQVNYQGIARNSVGNVLPNQPITVKLSIRDGSATGTVVYTETRNVTTNAFGLFFYGIGSPGATSVTGTLGGVNWASGNKYLQVEMDPKGGTAFTDAGTTQLLSVPYAFYAAGAPPTGNAGGSLTGTYPNPTIANGVITTAMIAPGVIPTTLPPSGPAGGSLTGNYPNPLIANNAITQAMLSPGITLPPNGPAGGSLTGNYPNPTIANGVITQAMLGPGLTLPPSGVAGGSLTGTYPNPTIANGAVNLSMIAPGVIPTSLPPTGAAGGDLSGTYPNPTVSKILGRTITNTAPAMNDVLRFDGTNWAPANLGSISDNVWATVGNDIHNINSGNVGIGINAPTRKLHVNGGDGYFSDSVIAKNIRTGSLSTETGLWATGTLYGVYSLGVQYGVFGGGPNVGVRGVGSSMGVHGSSSAADGKGVVGISDFGQGVFGAGPTGVWGSGGHTGVYGIGTSYGVKGQSEYAGVYSNGDQYGVVGYGGNTGVYGSSDGYGMQGHTAGGSGVYGQGTNGNGVYGFSYSGRGGNFYSQSWYGLWAKTDRADRSWAGVFEGNVYTFNAYQTSDENLKKNISDVDGAMNLLMQLKPKRYEFRNDGKLSNLRLPLGQHYGVLAQDLEAVLPNLIREVENEITPRQAVDTALSTSRASLEKIETIKIKAVNYTELIPIMIKGMQEQQQTIEEQKNKITALEARLNRLEAAMGITIKN